jgi:hypothetical protein
MPLGEPVNGVADCRSDLVQINSGCVRESSPDHAGGDRVALSPQQGTTHPLGNCDLLLVDGEFGDFAGSVQSDFIRFQGGS